MQCICKDGLSHSEKKNMQRNERDEIKAMNLQLTYGKQKPVNVFTWAHENGR